VPRSVLSAQGMQATTRVPNGVPNPIRHETDVVLHDSGTLHATHGVFTPHAAGGDATMGLLLRRGPLPSRGCFLGLHDRHVLPVAPLAAVILIPATAGWPGRACPFGPALLSGVPCTGVAHATHVTGRRDHAAVVARVTRLRAAVRVCWRFESGRAVARTCRAIMPTRGMLELPSAACVSTLVAHAAAVRAGRRAGSAQACFNTGWSP